MTSPAGCRSSIDPTPVPLEQPCQHYNQTSGTHTCTWRRIPKHGQSLPIAGFKCLLVQLSIFWFRHTALVILQCPVYCTAPIILRRPEPGSTKGIEYSSSSPRVSIQELKRGTEIHVPSCILTSVWEVQQVLFESICCGALGGQDKLQHTSQLS